MKQRQAYLYAMMAVLFWSTVASAFKIALRYVDFLHLLLYASLTSTMFLFVILLLQGKLGLLWRYSRREYLSSVLLGFLNPFLYYVVLFKAYSLLPAQEAQPLNYTWPIALVLLSIFFLKQKVMLRDIMGILVSFAGVAVIGTRGDLTALRFSNPLGVSLALGSSFIWALFWIYNARDRRDDIAKLFLNFLFGFPFVLLASTTFSEIKISGSPGFSGVSGLLGGIYVGFFEMGVTFVVWLRALQLSSSTAKIGSLVFLAPFISQIFIALVVGERILPSTVIGLILIASGIVLQQSGGKSASGAGPTDAGEEWTGARVTRDLAKAAFEE